LKYCLIEHLNPEYKLPTGCIYVALNQEAVYYLDKRNINYITFEDYYTSGEIRGNTDEYLVGQLKWFDEFDDLLKELYPEAKRLNLDLATIYYYWLKYMIDNIILTCRVIEVFIKKENPKKIIFINNNHGDDETKHWSHILHFQGVESTYSRLINTLCKKHGIQFERIILPITINSHTNKISIRKKAINYFPILYKIFNWIRYNRKIPRFFFLFYPISKKEKYNILLLSSHDIVYEFAKDIKFNSIKYFFHKSGIIYYFKSIFFQKTILKNNSRHIRTESGEDNLSSIDLKNIYDWINNKCDLNVEDALRSRIEQFINVICPEIIRLIPYYMKFYKEKNIKYIVASHIFTIEEHAALAAARLSKNTKSVYIHHGSDAFEAKSRYFYLDRYFDYYISGTKGEEEHEIRLRDEFGGKSPIIFHKNYLYNKYKNFNK